MIQFACKCCLTENVRAKFDGIEVSRASSLVPLSKFNGSQVLLEVKLYLILVALSLSFLLHQYMIMIPSLASIRICQKMTLQES